MKIARFHNILEAIEHSESGGVALHVWKPPRQNGESTWPGYDIPGCFKKSESWGHLLCCSLGQLEKTAKRLGISRVVVSKLGKRGQHVDLCGRPLEKAIEKAVLVKVTQTILGGVL